MNRTWIGRHRINYHWAHCESLDTRCTIFIGNMNYRLRNLAWIVRFSLWIWITVCRTLQSLAWSVRFSLWIWIAVCRALHEVYDFHCECELLFAEPCMNCTIFIVNMNYRLQNLAEPCMKCTIFIVNMNYCLQSLAWSVRFSLWIWITVCRALHEVYDFHCEYELPFAEPCRALHEVYDFHCEYELLFAEPCMRDPCRDKDHTSSDKCTQTGTGLFKNDYHCDCARGYDWDRFAMSCRGKSAIWRHLTYSVLYIISVLFFRCQFNELTKFHVDWKLIHTYIHTVIHTCIHTCIHTYTHTYIHTYITYIHTYIHTSHTYWPNALTYMHKIWRFVGQTCYTI